MNIEDCQIYLILAALVATGLAFLVCLSNFIQVTCGCRCRQSWSYAIMLHVLVSPRDV